MREERLMTGYDDPLFSTYSIVARDPITGQLGVAVQTHQMCVGAAVPWAQPGVGAIATQSSTNRSFGPLGLAMLREGLPAPRVLDALVATDAQAASRQVAVVDRLGRVAAWTGESCLPEAAHLLGEGFSVQANMMTRPTVVPAMADAFEGADGDLAQRMMAALRAAQAEGGDIRGMQSAALVVVPGDPETAVYIRDYDLRVDEHAGPVEELGRLVRLRHALRASAEGDRALGRGDLDEARRCWAKARQEAPELEEMAFHQALKLAEHGEDLNGAVELLEATLQHAPHREHWIDLIRRMDAVGSIQRFGLADELVARLGG
jgi:uncharacterized Ntn-hydrolase superfamily protein